MEIKIWRWGSENRKKARLAKWSIKIKGKPRENAEIQKTTVNIEIKTPAFDKV